MHKILYTCLLCLFLYFTVLRINKILNGHKTFTTDRTKKRSIKICNIVNIISILFFKDP